MRNLCEIIVVLHIKLHNRPQNLLQFKHPRTCQLVVGGVAQFYPVLELEMAAARLPSFTHLDDYLHYHYKCVSVADQVIETQK